MTGYQDVDIFLFTFCCQVGHYYDAIMPKKWIEIFFLKSDLHDSCYLHERDELGLDTVGQPAGKLSQESFEGPELFQLLITQREGTVRSLGSNEKEGTVRSLGSNEKAKEHTT
jgi:hypothetical protein